MSLLLCGAGTAPIRAKNKGADVDFTDVRLGARAPRSRVHREAELYVSRV